jgi:hypothetical protein
MTRAAHATKMNNEIVAANACIAVKTPNDVRMFVKLKMNRTTSAFAAMPGRATWKYRIFSIFLVGNIFLVKCEDGVTVTGHYVI